MSRSPHFRDGPVDHTTFPYMFCDATYAKARTRKAA